MNNTINPRSRRITAPLRFIQKAAQHLRFGTTSSRSYQLLEDSTSMLQTPTASPTSRKTRTVPSPKATSRRDVVASAQPLLRWGWNDDQGVTSSGWNPLSGANVCYCDTAATDGKISIIVEPPAPGPGLTVAAVLCLPYWPLISQVISARAEAHGYFFYKSSETGRIDMVHRSKPFRGKEERKVYKDCTYFGISVEKCRDPDGEIREESMFTLSSGYSDKQFPTGINFTSSSCHDLDLIVRSVNALIYSVQGEVDSLPSARVYPLFCTDKEYDHQCTEYENSLTSCDTDTIGSSDTNDCSDIVMATSIWLSGNEVAEGLEEGIFATCVVEPTIVVEARV